MLHLNSRPCISLLSSAHRSLLINYLNDLRTTRTAFQLLELDVFSDIFLLTDPEHEIVQLPLCRVVAQIPEDSLQAMKVDGSITFGIFFLI